MKNKLLITLITILAALPLDSWAQFKVRALFQPDTVYILAVGDIMMHTDQITNSAEHGYEMYFKEIEDRFKKADATIGNLEFTLAGKPYTGYPSFSAPDSYATYIANSGINIFLTANNHIHDKGAAGAARTLEQYDMLSKTHGIIHTGSARNEQEMMENFPLFFVRKGIRFAIINLTYGTNSSFASSYPKTYRLKSQEEVEAAFKRAKEGKADIIIAMPHWGEEYRLKHSEDQHNKAQYLADLGADIIIGGHPHVVQDYEILKTMENGQMKEVPVIYSLGNLISNMSAKNTRIGLMAGFKFVRKTSGDIEISEPEFEFTWCTLPGRKYGSHATVPVRRNIDKKADWKWEYDFELMVQTYDNVMKETGIYEKDN